MQDNDLHMMVAASYIGLGLLASSSKLGKSEQFSDSLVPFSTPETWETVRK
jgi:hypothetical protein